MLTITSSAPVARFRKLREAISATLERMLRSSRRRHSARQLSQLDGHLLRDIGLPAYMQGRPREEFEHFLKEHGL